jgi:segregation and condensation protein A
MTDYNIQLGAIYEGPIALLYELIRASKIDIYDIPIHEITEQYLKYLNMLKSMDIEITSDFVLMAATLMYIKSRMLLPLSDADKDEDREDPRKELIEKLLEYQKFKSAAELLEDKETAQSDIIFKESKQFIFDYKDENNWVDISIYDLINAFSNIIDYIEQPMFSQMAAEELTVAMKINEILVKLETADKFYFGELFSERVTRIEVVVTFLAILQLVKENTLRIQQHKMFGDIRIIKR